MFNGIESYYKSWVWNGLHPFRRPQRGDATFRFKNKKMNEMRVAILYLIVIGILSRDGVAIVLSCGKCQSHWSLPREGWLLSHQ